MARVLIVDDARFIRTLLTNMLTHAGHTIVGEAEHGDEAVSQFRLLRPDVVTMDITMPGRDGIGALMEIMKVDPAAKVIVCSAVNAKPKVIEALRAGASDFVLKPIKAERLLEALGRVLGSAAAAMPNAEPMPPPKPIEESPLFAIPEGLPKPTDTSLSMLPKIKLPPRKPLIVHEVAEVDDASDEFDLTV